MSNAAHRCVAVALLAILAIAMTPLTALATPVGGMQPTPSPRSHCVATVNGEGVRCFATFKEAIMVATGGLVHDAPAHPTDAVSSKAFETKVNSIEPGLAASYLLSIEYHCKRYATFSCSTLNVTGAGPCDANADLDWSLAYVGDAHNDRFSSFKGYSNCAVRHYEDRDFGGVRTEPATLSPDLGAMNDETSSLTFY